NCRPRGGSTAAGIGPSPSSTGFSSRAPEARRRPGRPPRPSRLVSIHPRQRIFLTMKQYIASPAENPRHAPRLAIFRPAGDPVEQEYPRDSVAPVDALGLLLHARRLGDAAAVRRHQQDLRRRWGWTVVLTRQDDPADDAEIVRRFSE